MSRPRRWLRPLYSSVSHATYRRTDAHVEFYCGRERDDDELFIPRRIVRCKECLAYIRNERRTQ